jgi:hypothetical protein
MIWKTLQCIKIKNLLMDGMTCFLNSIYIWGKGDRVRFNLQGEDKVEACLDIFNGEMADLYITCPFGDLVYLKLTLPRGDICSEKLIRKEMIRMYFP